MSASVALHGLLVGTLLVTVCALAGARALRALRFPARGLKLAVFGLAIGLAVTSHVTFALLLLGRFSGFAAWLILGGLAALSFVEAPTLARELRGQAPRMRAALAAPVDRLLAGVVAVVLALPLLQALAPPTSADTVAYHFALPRLFAEAGAFVPLPNIEANAPLGQHMLYTLGFGLQGAQTAAMVTLAQLVALAGAIILFGRERFSTRVGLLAAAVVATAPPLVTVAGSGEVETALGLYGFLALWASVDWLRGATRTLPVVAVLAGAAIATKYYGLLFFTALFVAVGIEALLRRRLPFPRLLLVATLLGVGALLWGSPAYLRNLVNVGNPVYPGAFSLFGGADWSVELDRVWRVWEETYKRPGGAGLLDLLAAPLRLGTDPSAFRAALVSWGPALIAFLPCVALLARNDARRDARVALVFAGTFFALWFLLAFHMQRHLAPVAGGVGIAAMAGFAAMGAGKPSVRRIAALVLTGAITLNVALAGVYHAEFAKPTFGMVDDDVYLRAQLRYQTDVEWMNTNLPADAKVMHFTRIINLYLDRPYLQATLFSQGRIDWLNLNTSDEVLSAAEHEGITHVFVDRNALEAEAGAFPAIGEALDHYTQLIVALLADHGTLVYEDERTAAGRRTLDLASVAIHPQVFLLESSATRGS